MNYITVQKQAILDWIEQTNNHPSARQVYEGVKEKLPSIGGATVYRNLDNLSKAGKIKELRVGKIKHYDSLIDKHQHFICIKCERIIDMHLSQLLNVEEISKKLNCHTILDYQLELRGICVNCKLRL